MKTYVSYVIQDDKNHKHLSEVVSTNEPLYSFSADPQVTEILKWAEEKKKSLNPHEELIITAIYKI
ncbi:MAG: hypothetical protein ACXVLT_07360 [Flavisolibacter sp.]